MGFGAMTETITERFRKSVILRLSILGISRAEFCRRSQAVGLECDQHWLHRILKTDNLRVRDIEHMADLLGIGDSGFFVLIGVSPIAINLSRTGDQLNTLIEAPIPEHLSA